MGERLVIMTTISDANDILKIIKDPKLLNWEWVDHHLDVAVKWLPKKGFKILPKLFDADYRPGTVGDEGDRLVTKVHGCVLRSLDMGEPIPIWKEQILKIPEMREELRRVIEEKVLDISFEEEVVKDIEKWSGKPEIVYKADDEGLKEDNETLQRLGKILMMLADCMDQVKRIKGVPLFFDFYI